MAWGNSKYIQYHWQLKFLCEEKLIIGWVKDISSALEVSLQRVKSLKTIILTFKFVKIIMRHEFYMSKGVLIYIYSQIKIENWPQVSFEIYSRIFA